MKRICFISLSAYGYFDESAPAGGGAQRQFHLLSTNLTDHFDVHFIVGDYGQPITEERNGVTLHRAYRPESDASPTQRIQQLLALWRALYRADADLYIARCFPRKLAVLHPLMSVLRQPLIFHVAGDPFVEKPVSGVTGIRRFLYNRALRNVSEVIAQTPYQATQLRRHWSITAPVIPNGYPPSSVVDRFDTREYFLWVGRLDKQQKQPHVFLDIAESHPDQEFVLIGPADGDTEYTQDIEKRAENMGNVHYTGPVEPTEIHNYYRHALALINTSKYEGFPNTFLEAWRYATPVLSLNIDTGRFLKESVGSCGYADDDLSKLNDLVAKIAKSQEFRRKSGIKGIQTFSDRYQITTVAEAYKHVIQDTLNSD